MILMFQRFVHCFFFAADDFRHLTTWIFTQKKIWKSYHDISTLKFLIRNTGCLPLSIPDSKSKRTKSGKNRNTTLVSAWCIKRCSFSAPLEGESHVNFLLSVGGPSKEFVTMNFLISIICFIFWFPPKEGWFPENYHRQIYTWHRRGIINGQRWSVYNMVKSRYIGDGHPTF